MTEGALGIDWAAALDMAWAAVHPEPTGGEPAAAGQPSIAEERASGTETDAARDLYEERAAILEFDAGLSRGEAERLARRMHPV